MVEVKFIKGDGGAYEVGTTQLVSPRVAQMLLRDGWIEDPNKVEDKPEPDTKAKKDK